MQRTKIQPTRRLDLDISAAAAAPRYPIAPAARAPERRAPSRPSVARGVDRWADEELFEEDVRSVMQMLRPHRTERLMGWNEYRTGGKHFRATVTWDEDFAADTCSNPDPQPADDVFTVPNFADVIESLLVGSVRADVDLTPEQRTQAYRDLLTDVGRRLGQHPAGLL